MPLKIKKVPHACRAESQENLLIQFAFAIFETKVLISYGKILFDLCKNNSIQLLKYLFWTFGDKYLEVIFIESIKI